MRNIPGPAAGRQCGSSCTWICPYSATTGYKQCGGALGVGSGAAPPQCGGTTHRGRRERAITNTKSPTLWASRSRRRGYRARALPSPVHTPSAQHTHRGSGGAHTPPSLFSLHPQPLVHHLRVWRGTPREPAMASTAPVPSPILHESVEVPVPILDQARPLRGGLCGPKRSRRLAQG